MVMSHTDPTRDMMSTTASNSAAISAALNKPVRRSPLLPNGVVGMLFFIIVEMMYFAALVSAHSIVKAGFGVWPPLGQPRLPVATTAISTLVLLCSGVLLLWAQRTYTRRSDAPQVRSRLIFAIVLGAVFVMVQGTEWVRLLHYGLTMQSSAFGGFFYLIIGSHALHAVAALTVLGMMLRRLRAGNLTASAFTTAQLFWSFVVLVWPLLYVIVYLV